jgi:urease accessory protein
MQEETSMTSTWRSTLRGGAAATLALTATLAQAHTGHGAASLLQGLAHPLALDHLLAAVAVGLWSARALPAGRVWQGPAVFLLALAAGALAAQAGLGFFWIEQAIALSIALFGAMLVLACRGDAALPGRGLPLVAAAAALHGLAHGAEAGGAAFGAYAIGFVATTAALHAAGLSAGFALQRLRDAVARRIALALGAGLGATGLVLFGLA